MIKRFALSPVISSIILSAMVLIIGAGVWSYSNSAASAISADYAYETIEIINTLQERFMIENVCFDNDTHILSLWIYNYGDVSLTLNNKITIEDTNYQNNSITIGSDSYQKITFNVGTSLEKGEEVIIYVTSYRGNIKNEIYYIK